MLETSLLETGLNHERIRKTIVYLLFRSKLELESTLLCVFQRFRFNLKTELFLKSGTQLSQTMIWIPEDISFITSLGSKPGRINCDSGLLAIYLRVHSLIFLLSNGDLRQ